eukprot:5077672-Pleurochrysis_carterae.AAC.1
MCWASQRAAPHFVCASPPYLHHHHFSDSRLQSPTACGTYNEAAQERLVVPPVVAFFNIVLLPRMRASGSLCRRYGATRDEYSQAVA